MLGASLFPSRHVELSLPAMKFKNIVSMSPEKSTQNPAIKEEEKSL
jgi:hypothetical protein